MLGFVAIIIFTIYAFKSARDYGRNGFLWAFVTFCIGFGIQIAAPMFVGILLGIVWLLQGRTADEIQSSLEGPSILVGIIATVLSLVAMALVLKFVSRVRDGVEIPPAKRAGSLGLDN